MEKKSIGQKNISTWKNFIFHLFYGTPTPPPPPQKKALFKIKVSSKTCWRLCVQIKFVLMNHIVTKEQNKLLYCIHMYEHWCEYKKFLRLDIWDAHFTIQGLWELISNHFTTKNTIYSHSFFSRVFKNAATANL